LRGLHPAAVHLDQPADEAQPDAKPALLPLQRPTDLREYLEDGSQLLRRDAHAVVLDAHDGVAPVPLDGQPDVSARRGVAGAVVEQVGEHLRQPGAVAVHVDRPGRQRDRQFVPAVL
jgi:hypothetical protein